MCLHEEMLHDLQRQLTREKQEKHTFQKQLENIEMRLAMAVPDMELQEHDGIGATKENSLWTFMLRSSVRVTMTVSKGSQSEVRRHIEDARHRRRPHEDPVARHESKPSFRHVVINTSRHDCDLIWDFVAFSAAACRHEVIVHCIRFV